MSLMKTLLKSSPFIAAVGSTTCDENSVFQPANGLENVKRTVFELMARADLMSS
jgi:hypothetical protein